MKIKLTLCGKPDQGKTYTLRCLIYLLTKGNEKINGYLSLQEKRKTPILPFDMNMDEEQKDCRVAFVREVNGKNVKFAISTFGDAPEEINRNWDMFCQRIVPDTKTYKTLYQLSEEPDVAISPCHPSGKAFDAEIYNTHANYGIPVTNQKRSDIQYMLWLRIEELSTRNEVKQLEREIDYKLYTDAFKFIFIKDERKSSNSVINEAQKKNCFAMAMFIKQQIDKILS